MFLENILINEKSPMVSVLLKSQVGIKLKILDCGLVHICLTIFDQYLNLNLLILFTLNKYN